MSIFDLVVPRRVMFGPGRADEMAELLPALGQRVLLCTGGTPSRHRHLLGGVDPVAVVTVPHEPTVGEVRNATETGRAAGADVVVAVGGGSVLDLGKAVAVLLTNGTDPLDHLEIVGRGVPVQKPAVPFVAVPTTAGTGAEATANAALSSPEHGIKASIRSPHMLAAVALVDPLLTLSCPPGVTASSGLDALTQCLEAFVSVRANPVTDALAAEGLRRAASGLRRAYADSSDLAARTDLAICALLSGMALANARLGAVHGFAGVVGGIVAVPHGLACAALLVPVVEANVRAGAAPDRYREVARLLTGRPDATVADGVAWLRETVTILGVPGLGRYGLRPDQAAEVVAKTATASSTQGNPVVLTDDQLHEILYAAIGP